MSIRKVQAERVLVDIVHQLYSEGVKPTFDEIRGRLGQYFAAYPAGSPLPLPNSGAVSGVSNPDDYNKIFANTAINLDVLYEVSIDQVNELLDLTRSMQDSLERLTRMRKRIEGKIDDYLLALYDTDGYFYTVSDNFADNDMVDLNLTSAEISPSLGAAVIPTDGALSRRVERKSMGSPSVRVRVRDNENYPKEVVSPINNALIAGNLTNTVWAIEVETDQEEEVVVTVTLPFIDDDPVKISRIDITPYGKSVQAWIKTLNNGQWNDFGDRIQSASTKMSFHDGVRRVKAVRIFLRKDKADYVDRSGGSVKHRYTFGARDFAFMHQVYDEDAVVVSQPLTLPVDLANEMVIDAVSLAVDDNVPAGSSIRYYVATTNGEEEALDEFDWRQITPVQSDQPGDKVVRFDGAQHITRYIYEDAEGQDLPLIPLAPPSATPVGAEGDQNPSPAIIPGVDVYRIAKFEDDVLINSLSLLEGVNTVRAFSIPLAENAVKSLEFWRDYRSMDRDDVGVFFGRIDTGEGFFNGANLDGGNRSVLVETELHSPLQRDTFLSEFQKLDAMSEKWNIRVFLNDQQIGHLPVGTNKLVLPWRFQEGKNVITLLINIPANEPGQLYYTGAVALLGDDEILEYGEVYLDKWRYVDFFALQYHQAGQPRTFTIHNDEIISRRQPTTNFALKYSVPSGTSAAALRVRADLKREGNNPASGPKLSEYRLRFGYNPEDV